VATRDFIRTELQAVLKELDERGAADGLLDKRH
jgi:hypothetical protein